MGTFYGVQPITRFGDITTSGLFGKRYVGNYAGNPNFLKTATLQGATDTTTELNWLRNDGDNYSWMWLGYFRPTTTETYTFTLVGIDDYADVWVGTSAIKDYATSNRVVGAVVGGASGSISLQSELYYPFRIMFGESGGAERMILQFSTPTIATRTDGLGYYFGGPAAWNRFGTL